jgi:4-amino-4-deoxy-L-arabinose transferase-like glycosyltransferase
MRLRLLILLLATLFQTHQLTQDIRFHPDEAFFMTFARHASVNGDWMLSGSLDKPPLSIYMSALSMALVGNTTDTDGVLHLAPHIGEFSGRLPNVFLAILLVAVMMRLAHDLYHDERVTLLTGLLTATSPYLLMFGATAFTDMSLLFWLVVALGLAVRGKWGWAGIALGLAFWSKQQAIFYVPLFIVIILYKYRRDGILPVRAPTVRFFRGWIITLLLLLIWDTSRPDTSIFLLGTVNNAPDSLLANPSTYLIRLHEWLNLSAWLIGPAWLTMIIVIIAVIGWLQHLIKRDPSRWWDTLFGLFIMAYIGLHTVLAFNQYDRYLLLIVPPLILFCMRGLILLIGKFPLPNVLGRGLGDGVWAGIVIICLASTLYTLHIGIPIGGDKGDYHRIDDLANYLNSKPIATVIYDRWLGWELGYYLGQWTNKRRVYFPTPSALAKGALALDEIGDRYLVAPIDQPLSAWLSALESVGFTIYDDYQTERFMVYRLSVSASDA